MDLNRQFFDHQVALIRAGLTRCTTGRSGHEARADRIAQRIGQYQRALGAHMPALLPAAGRAAA